MSASEHDSMHMPMPMLNERYYNCDFCNKQYKLKSHFDKHMLLCSIKSKTVDERKRENEIIELTPPPHQMYELIKQLIHKNDLLERKVEKLSAWVNNTKKKVNVIDWMNENQTIGINFGDWLNSIEITKEDMELVFNYNFLEGIRFIIQRLVGDAQATSVIQAPGQTQTQIPVKAFDQKEGIIYIFENGWTIMTPELFEKFFGRIAKGLLTQLKGWQDINRHRICDNGFTEVYIDNVKKIMGGDLTREQQYTRVKKMLYNHVKINLKNVIQYDFEF